MANHAGVAAGEKVPWRRKLYLKQDYPDTYMEPSNTHKVPGDQRAALPLLRYVWENVRAPDKDTRDLLFAIYKTGNNCSILIVGGLVFSAIKEKPWIFSYAEMFVFVGLVFLITVCRTKKGEEREKGSAVLKSSAFVGLYLQILTPILRNLVHSISSDTIYMFSMFLSAFLIFPFNIASLSSGIFIAIMLCSRLDETFEVGGFMLVCTVVVLYMCRTQEREDTMRRIVLRRAAYMLLSGTSGCIILRLGSPGTAAVVLFVEAFFGVLLPLVAIGLRKYKV